MIKSIKTLYRRTMHKCYIFLVPRVGKCLITLLGYTCRWKVHGLELFTSLAEKEKCIVTLWHNRLILAPQILYYYVPQCIFTGFVSSSRDGELISSIVESYRTGKTIRVPHNSRHEALRAIIKEINEKKSIAVITPDGPRGPKYKIKPGLALAAVETEAYVFVLSWKSTRFWELNTWDKLRIPKPFSTIDVTFSPPVRFKKEALMTHPEAQQLLEEAMDKFNAD